MVILVEVQAESVEGNPFEYLLLFTENVESNDFYKVELFDSEAMDFFLKTVYVMVEDSLLNVTFRISLTLTDFIHRLGLI